LVTAMLRDVLAGCAASPDLDGVIAVLDSEIARHIGGVTVVADPGEMNAAACAGIEEACQRGASSVLVLPADIPLISANDLRRITTATTAARAVVVGASRDGEGTNALLLRPPDAIRPSFGPPSLARHLALGAHADCETTVLADLDLALDVDTPEDLALLRQSRDLPPHTRAC